MEPSSSKKRILILGGGFAGAYAALQLQKELRGAPDIEVLLVAQENFVLFTPMLHEVAGSDAAATDVVQPLRKMLRHTNILIGDIESIDLEKKQVNVRQTDAVHHRELGLRPSRSRVGFGVELLPHAGYRRACVDNEDAGRCFGDTESRH